MSNKQVDYTEYVTKISQRGVSIYDSVDPDLWIPTPDLEALLNDELVGMSLHRLPIRTRSKVVKQAICRALGYPIPRSFKKHDPGFQNSYLTSTFKSPTTSKYGMRKYLQHDGTCLSVFRPTT